MTRREACETLSVPAAGRRFYDLGRSASFAAARRGDLLTVAVGPKLLRVPIELQRELMRARARCGHKAPDEIIHKSDRAAAR
jgi:hypothetical protein